MDNQNKLINKIKTLPEELEIKIYEYVHHLNFYPSIKNIQRTRSFLLSIPIIKNLFTQQKKSISRYMVKLCKGSCNKYHYTGESRHY